MTEREHQLSRLIRTFVRVLLLLIGVFQIGMTTIFLFVQPRGAVLYMLNSTGASATFFGVWSLLTVIVALSGIFFISHRIHWWQFGLMLFSITPGVFYTYETFGFISQNSAIATPMVLWMEIQSYVVLTFLMMIFSVFMRTLNPPEKPKDKE